ncbi:hypothetical protein GGI35DRAFT_454626 [Trichoderma velutinum]
MEVDRIYDELMKEAPMQESVSEEASTGDISMEERQIPWQQQLGEMMPDDQLDDTLLASILTEPMPETPMEEDSTTETPTPEVPTPETPTTGISTTRIIPDTSRQLSRRPPRWQQSTATQSKLHRALHTHRLESEIEEYSLNREEIQEFAPPETRQFLMGMRPPPPMDAVARIEERFNGKEPDSAKVNALLVPQNRLQVVRFNEAIRMRDFYETATLEEMIRCTMPAPYETWKMEKEYSDLREALGVVMQTIDENEREREHRARLWSRSRSNQINLYRSRGYGSSFREVISIDEDWPEEDWASAGLEQPDAPFLVRCEAKMKMRPVLVRERKTEPR